MYKKVNREWAIEWENQELAPLHAPLHGNEELAPLQGFSCNPCPDLPQWWAVAYRCEGKQTFSHPKLLFATVFYHNSSKTN